MKKHNVSLILFISMLNNILDEIKYKIGIAYFVCITRTRLNYICYVLVMFLLDGTGIHPLSVFLAQLKAPQRPVPGPCSLIY